MQDRLILAQRIALDLKNKYDYFILSKIEEPYEDGWTKDDFLRVLKAYGLNVEDPQLYQELEAASEGLKQLPTAAVPNADQLKRLIEEHEKLIEERAKLGPSVTSQWINQQRAVVEKRLEEVETASAVVYEASEPLRQTQGEPVAKPVATGTKEGQQDEVSDWSKEKRIKNLETILAEANIPQPFRHSTAEQLDQVLELSQAEGIPLDQERLKERIFTIVSRITTQPPAPEVVETIAERIPSQRTSTSLPSVFESFARPLRPQAPQPREKRVQAEPKTRDIAQQYLYLALREEPYWRQLSRQLLPINWFGLGINPSLQNLQVVQAAIQRIRAQNPVEYARNMPILVAAEERVNALIAAGKIIETVEFVAPATLVLPETVITPETVASPEATISTETAVSSEEAIRAQAVISDPTRKLYRLEINPQTQVLEVQSTTKQDVLQSLPAAPLPEQKRERDKAQQFVRQQIVQEAFKEAQSARQNLFSNFAIRFKNFLINTSNGIGRFFSFTFPQALGFGSRIGSGLVATAVPGSEGSLAIPASRMLGGLFNLGGVGLRGGATIASRALMGLAALGGAEALPLAAILAVGLGAVFVLAIFVITIQHGVFVKETTSIGTVPESNFIDLSKVALPTAIANSSLPAKVQYTIAVKAKEKGLKNVRTNEEFFAYGKGGPSAPVARQHSINPTIPAGKSESFNFEITLGPEFADSIVTNLVNVTADVEDGPSGEKASRSAVVTIGSPPTGCFVFKSGWSDASEQAKVTEMINRLSASAYYKANLCRGGSIDIIRSHYDPGWSGQVNNQREIYLFNRAFAREGKYIWQNLFYTLAHESGHVYAWRNESVYYDFPKNPPTGIGNEPFLPTYTLKKEIAEDFAETIAVYVIRRAVPNLSGYNIVNMNTSYPKHYEFARDKIFNGFDGF